MSCAYKLKGSGSQLQLLWRVPLNITLPPQEPSFSGGSYVLTTKGNSHSYVNIYKASKFLHNQYGD